MSKPASDALSTLYHAARARLLGSTGRLALIATLTLAIAAPVLLDASEAHADGPRRVSKSRSKGKSKSSASSRSYKKRTRSASRSRSGAAVRTYHRGPRATRHYTRTRRTYYGHRRYGHYHRGHYFVGVYPTGYVRTTRVVYTDSDSAYVREDEPRVVTEPRIRSSAFFDFGAGTAGAVVSDAAPTSFGLQLGMGVRYDNVAFGVSALGLLVDSPEGAVDAGAPNQGLILGGLAADARLYLPLGPLEPYGLVGLGYYNIDDDPQTSAFRPTVDLGGGVDLRFNRSLAVGGRWTYHGYWIGANAPRADGTLQPDGAWSALGTVTVSF